MGWLSVLPLLLLPVLVLWKLGGVRAQGETAAACSLLRRAGGAGGEGALGAAARRGALGGPRLGGAIGVGMGIGIRNGSGLGSGTESGSGLGSGSGWGWCPCPAPRSGPAPCSPSGPQGAEGALGACRGGEAGRKEGNRSKGGGAAARVWAGLNREN